eukprot:13267514-Heterocapsa_arctica.AAC.1
MSPTAFGTPILSWWFEPVKEIDKNWVCVLGRRVWEIQGTVKALGNLHDTGNDMLEDSQDNRHPDESCCRITAKNEDESKDIVKVHARKNGTSRDENETGMKRDNLPNNQRRPLNSEEQCFDKNEPIKSDDLLKELDLKDT